MTLGLTSLLIWVFWAAVWLTAAVWSVPTSRHLGFAKEWPFWCLTCGGAFLLFARLSDFLNFGVRFWHFSQGIDQALVGTTAFGLVFACWGRFALGLLWSASVVQKSDHRLIDTGPYGVVRHPIYAGLILALWATAIQKGTPMSLIGVLLMSLGFWIKARLEECFLAALLPAGAYDAYRCRVPMLFPSVRRLHLPREAS